MSAAVFIVLNKFFPVVQPTWEDCDVVTVGKKEWFGEATSVDREDEEDKKSAGSGEKTSVVQV